MPVIPASLYEIRTVIPASLDSIEPLLADLRRGANCALRPRDRFAAELLLREALTNAVVHGCHRDPTRSIWCVLRIKSNRLTIVVEDAGQGFDWRAARSRKADISDCSGRGMEIYSCYATRFRFNDRGNRVTISKDFDE
jgi:anti-sigma regulatory factor (Ser/Thr protein kinase)